MYQGGKSVGVLVYIDLRWVDMVAPTAIRVPLNGGLAKTIRGATYSKKG